MIGWLLVAHTLLWFFIMWFARLLIVLITRESLNRGLIWQALVMGMLSLLFHYSLNKVAAVPLHL